MNVNLLSEPTSREDMRSRASALVWDGSWKRNGVGDYITTHEFAKDGMPLFKISKTKTPAATYWHVFVWTVDGIRVVGTETTLKAARLTASRNYGNWGGAA